MPTDLRDHEFGSCGICGAMKMRLRGVGVCDICGIHDLMKQQTMIENLAKPSNQPAPPATAQSNPCQSSQYQNRGGPNFGSSLGSQNPPPLRGSGFMMPAIEFPQPFRPFFPSQQFPTSGLSVPPQGQVPSGGGFSNHPVLNFYGQANNQPQALPTQTQGQTVGRPKKRSGQQHFEQSPKGPVQPVSSSSNQGRQQLGNQTNRSRNQPEHHTDPTQEVRLMMLQTYATNRLKVEAKLMEVKDMLEDAGVEAETVGLLDVAKIYPSIEEHQSLCRELLDQDQGQAHDEQHQSTEASAPPGLDNGPEGGLIHESNAWPANIPRKDIIVGPPLPSRRLREHRRTRNHK